MNLHSLAINMIKAVHSTEVCTIYQSMGQVNTKGVIKPQYKEPFSAELDVQPLSAQDLQTYQQVRDVKIDWKCYLYSDKAFPIAGVTRLPQMRTGDFIKRADGRWLLVTTVLEDWRDEGWASVGAVEQLDPPDFGV